MHRLPQHASFGFTAPTDIYDVMRSVKTSADALNRDVSVNVADPAFRAAWLAWYQEWNAFFERNYRTFGTLLHTDELKAQTEAYRLQLLSWYEAYGRQTTPVGTPVPPVSGVPPLRPATGAPSTGAPQGTPEGASEPLIPWWGWVLGGAALVGVGYLGYRHYVAKRPGLGVFGRDRGYILSARDPDMHHYWTALPARDPYESGYRPAGNPLRAESYARAVEVQHAPPPPALPAHVHDYAPPRGGYR